MGYPRSHGIVASRLRRCFHAPLRPSRLSSDRHTATEVGQIGGIIRRRDRAVFSRPFPNKTCRCSNRSQIIRVRVCVSMSTVRGPVTIVVIYRPPGRPDANFYNEFTSYLEVVATFNSQLVIAGDLNIHFEQPTDPVTMRINQLLASFALVQHVDQPTHQCGGILDVIVTRSDCSISDMVIDPPSLSDHGPVSCTIPCACPASPIFT